MIAGERKPTEVPDLTLIRAVLVRAIEDFRGLGQWRSPRQQREVRVWFSGPYNPTWPCTFPRVCAMLGLEPDAVRRALGL